MLYSVHVLRFVAATGVVVHHSDLLAPLNTTIGAAGVDLFFVISGLVIGTSTRPDMRIRDFLIRRFVRIYPLYWTATAALLIYMTRFGPAPNLGHLVRSILLLPPELSTGWLPLYQPAWTLVFEVFFYAAFALCMLTGRYARFVCCAALAAFAFVFSDPASPSLYRALGMLLFEFIAGLLISLAVERRLLPGRILGAFLVALAVVLFVRNSVPPGLAREIGWGIPSVLLVYGMLAFEPARILRHPLLVLGGNASYAIYLFHGTVMQAVGLFFFLYGSTMQEHPQLYAAIGIPLSLMVGALVYLALDRPMLRYLGKVLVHRPAAAH